MLMSSLSIRAWAMIGTGLVIALLVAGLLMTRATLADTKRERDAAELKLSVSNGSVRRLEGEIARMVGEQKALADDDANRINASRQKLQIIDAVARVREAAIDRLNASAAVIRTPDATGQCKVSAAFMGEWQ